MTSDIILQAIVTGLMMGLIYLYHGTTYIHNNAATPYQFSYRVFDLYYSNLES